MPRQFELDPDIPGDDPARKFILLMLYQAQGDHATRVVVGESTSDWPPELVPIKYQVNGIWYDMLPFPRHYYPSVVSKLLAMACVPVDASSPKEGTFDETVEDFRLRWKLAISDSQGKRSARRRAQRTLGSRMLILIQQLFSF